jgi:methylmalonyl-CoA carboxyltransferase 1.3S subunit
LKLQIAIDGKTYEAEVEVLEEDAIPRQLQNEPCHPLPAAARPVTTVRGPSVDEEVADEARVCRSPVTGIVIKVNIEPGQTVQANEPILVLEAMKMETNVTAHCTGKVKNVRVEQGDSVKVNQVVAEFE